MTNMTVVRYKNSADLIKSVLKIYKNELEKANGKSVTIKCNGQNQGERLISLALNKLATHSQFAEKSLPQALYNQALNITEEGQVSLTIMQNPAITLTNNRANLQANELMNKGVPSVEIPSQATNSSGITPATR